MAEDDELRYYRSENTRLNQLVATKSERIAFLEKELRIALRPIHRAILRDPIVRDLRARNEGLTERVMHLMRMLALHNHMEDKH